MIGRSVLLGSMFGLAVLADSWPVGAFEGLPKSDPEISAQRGGSGRMETESDALPPSPAGSEAPALGAAAPSEKSREAAAISHRAVDPSGWLGRRHARSPA
jgi:hypothetical protein